MDRERLDRVAELFEAARALSPDRRREYLAAECGSDEPLRAEVESLLSEHEADSSALEPGHDAAVLRRWIDVGGTSGRSDGPPPFEITGFRLLSLLGAASLPMPVPTSVPAGLETYWQAWIVDATGPAGFTTTNGLLGVTP
jgi:hypothetical protein